MNNPFDYVPDKACNEAFKELTKKLEVMKQSESPTDVNFCRELESGKMLGVLIAQDASGCQHTLYAFSGQIGANRFHHPGFVEPVFDYLQPDGYFRTNEADISRQNADIKKFEDGPFARLKSEYTAAKKQMDEEVRTYKEKCRQSKLERDAKRATSIIEETEMAEMIRQSQFEKAELRRLKNRLADQLQPLAAEWMEAQSQLETMKEKRRKDSEALQEWLFNNFKLLNARGESRNLSEIFAHTPMGVPPSGAGECCAPKLLQAAYKRGLQPVAIAEYWYGKPKDGELRIHGMHYPACRGKCLPVLRWMLQGLSVDPHLDSETVKAYEPKVIYENQWFCVVDKPSGMLSVPGKGEAISVQQWLEEKYGKDMVKLVHRIDQDTSGLLLAAFDEVTFKVMQSFFASRRVKKTYMAELEGDYVKSNIPKQGRIKLPLAPDYLDRPRQRIDFEKGKEAETDYEFVEVKDGLSRIVFHPLTGRTHQLRVHAASEQGLGMPISGDPLYGRGNEAGRLLLHAHKLEFVFPIDKKLYSFESPCPF